MCHIKIAVLLHNHLKNRKSKYKIEITKLCKSFRSMLNKEQKKEKKRV